MLDNDTNIHCNPLRFVKVMYVSNYMLIYAKILKSFDHLNILHVDSQMLILHNL